MRRHRRRISISLSLSLSTPGLAGKKPSPGAKNGAPDHLLAGSRRALGCGIGRSRLARGLLERRCHCHPLWVGGVRAGSVACSNTRRSCGAPRSLHARPRRPLFFFSGGLASSLSGRRGASRSRTQEAKCALHTSDRGRRDAPPIVVLNLGRPPYRPGRAFRGAGAVGLSPVWFPGRRGPDPARGAQPFCNPSRAHERSPTGGGC